MPETISIILSGISISLIIIVTTILIIKQNNLSNELNNELMIKQNELSNDYNNKIKKVVSQVNEVNATGYNVIKNQETGLNDINFSLDNIKASNFIANDEILKNITDVRSKYVTSEDISKKLATTSANIGELATNDAVVNRKLTVKNGDLNVNGKLNTNNALVNGDLNVNGKLNTNGPVNINGNINTPNGNILHSDGRQHLSAEEILYLLPKKGVQIGKEWGGTGNLNVQGTVTTPTGIQITNGDPGPLIEKRYNWQNYGDRYGVGQFPNGQMKMYAATSFPGNVSMSLARADGTFDDIITVNPNKSVNIKGTVTTPTGIQITNGDPGPLIEKRYNLQNYGDRYGVGQFPNGQMKMYAATSFPGNVSMSLARVDGTFDDIITVNPNKSVNIKGPLNVINGANNLTTNGWAVGNQKMAPGSLTIGGGQKYGNGNNWTNNTSGLLMECGGETEIAVHDYNRRIASIAAYNGSTNQITIGRDMAWGPISAVNIQGALNANGVVNVKDKLCIGTTCLDANQLKTLMTNAGV
jgi:hypothetical protein